MHTARSQFDYLAIFIAIVAIVTIVGVIWPVLSRPSHGHRGLRDGTMLKQAHLGMTAYYTRKGRVAPSWMLMIHNGYIVPELCFSYYTPRDLRPSDMLSLGSYSVEDIYDPATTAEELEAEAVRVIREEPWERLGDLYLSREAAAADSFEPDLVAGVMLYASDRHPDGTAAYFVFSDNHVSLVPLPKSGENNSEYLTVLDADRRIRHSLGLSDPPDYAALIRAHTAEQHRLANAGK